MLDNLMGRLLSHIEQLVHKVDIHRPDVQSAQCVNECGRGGRRQQVMGIQPDTGSRSAEVVNEEARGGTGQRDSLLISPLKLC